MANKMKKMGILLCLIASGVVSMAPIDAVAQTAKKATTSQQVSNQRTVSGRVTDTEGEPLVGAPISIGDTRVCAVTDADGFYTVQIPREKTILKFTYVGMTPQYITITPGSSNLQRNIIMTSSNMLRLHSPLATI